VDLAIISYLDHLEHDDDEYSYRLTTIIGRRSFPVAAATVWNTLPVHVQSSPSIVTFPQRLKTFLFQQSFLDIII